ncbi:MAG: PadR family transcriptional regulator [Bacteroidota bacterium]|nr:PadR family transcriptional regulator [Bacteroidota bacterium]
MNTEKQKTQMKRGVLELCILSIIAEKDAYASDILEKLKASKLIVVEGTLYPLLTRLKNDGLTTYRWEESRSGPPRKYFQITEIGLKVLNELNKGWQELVSSVNDIVYTENKESKNKS